MQHSQIDALVKQMNVDTVTGEVNSRVQEIVLGVSTEFGP